MIILSYPAIRNIYLKMNQNEHNNRLLNFITKVSFVNYKEIVLIIGEKYG